MRRWAEWMIAAFSGAGMAAAGMTAGLYLNASPVPETAQAVVARGPQTVWVLPIVESREAAAQVDSSELLLAMDESVDWYDRAAGDPSVRVFVLAGALDPVVLPEPPAKRKSRECKDVEEAAQAAASTLEDGAVVVALVANPRECPYAGLAEVDGKWAIAVGYDTATSEVPTKTVIHELGHILGLPHAKRYTCPIQTQSAAPAPDPFSCEVEEYGDPADPMGKMPKSLHAGFNPFSLSELGWGEPPIRLSTAGSHRVFLKPVDAVGPDYVALPNRLAVSFRAAPVDNEERSVDGKIGRTRDTQKIHGVFVHQFPIIASDGSTLLPFSESSAAGQEGDHYVAEDGMVAFRVEEIVPGQGVWLSVYIRATGADPLTDRWGPGIHARVTDLDRRNSLVSFIVRDQSGVTDRQIFIDGSPVGDGDTDLLTLRRPKVGEPPLRITVHARDGQQNVSTQTVFVTAPRAWR